MHKEKTTGLFLGKFAPLHKGHQHVIETALDECDEVIVLIYETSVTNIPLSVRAGWIENLYPTVRVIKVWDSMEELPHAHPHDRTYEISEEECAKKILGGTKITHFYSSEYYGEHMSAAFGAIDRRIDMNRSAVPVSATQIRDNPLACRMSGFLDNAVYESMIAKIVFLGAESTGKSTLTKAVAEEFRTEYVEEYGREYWERHQIGGKLTPHDLTELCKGHLRDENRKVLLANKYLFVDTNAITTYIYAQEYHGGANDEVAAFARACHLRYDLTFVCGTDCPYDDTPDRLGLAKRREFHARTLDCLKTMKIPYVLLEGTLEERIAQVKEVLKTFVKYGNCNK